MDDDIDIQTRERRKDSLEVRSSSLGGTWELGSTGTARFVTLFNGAFLGKRLKFIPSIPLLLCDLFKLCWLFL